MLEFDVLWYITLERMPRTFLCNRTPFLAPLLRPHVLYVQGLLSHDGVVLDRSEGVVLWWDLSDEIVAHDRQLGEDVFANFGDVAEEEEGEDSRGSTEACC